MNKFGIRTTSILTVATPLGPREVEEFEQAGPFAVYRSLGYVDGWTLGHVASGYAVRADLPSREVALDLGRRLSESRLDWNFTDGEAVKSWPKSAGAIVRKALKEAMPEVSAQELA